MFLLFNYYSTNFCINDYNYIFFYIYFTIKKNSNIKEYINKPFLPSNIDDKPEKKYHKTKYNSSYLRFHYMDLYKNRTIFEINYSYRPYMNISKLLSFDENGKNIMESTGMLNMTLLNIYYYNNIQKERN